MTILQAKSAQFFINSEPLTGVTSFEYSEATPKDEAPLPSLTCEASVEIQLSAKQLRFFRRLTRPTPFMDHVRHSLAWTDTPWFDPRMEGIRTWWAGGKRLRWRRVKKELNREARKWMP